MVVWSWIDLGYRKKCISIVVEPGKGCQDKKYGRREEYRRAYMCSSIFVLIFCLSFVFNFVCLFMCVFVYILIFKFDNILYIL